MVYHYYKEGTVVEFCCKQIAWKLLKK
ncbi:hypothetical protein Gotur_031895 [Gossypium turneri]